MLTERRIGTLGLAQFYFPRQLITLKGVARTTNPVGKRQLWGSVSLRQKHSMTGEPKFVGATVQQYGVRP